MIMIYVVLNTAHFTIIVYSLKCGDRGLRLLSVLLIQFLYLKRSLLIFWIFFATYLLSALAKG